VNAAVFWKLQSFREELLSQVSSQVSPQVSPQLPQMLVQRPIVYIYDIYNHKSIYLFFKTNKK
jgi:hypothetical protein